MTATPEFSRLVAIEGLIPDKTRQETVEATEEECAALAKRFDLRAISGLKARLTIRRVAGGEVIRVAGDFEADVVQICTISLRDVFGRIEGSFETFFTEGDVNEEDEDAPEALQGGMLDLGEIVAQYLSLEIDPYPRAPGVNLAAQLAEAGIKGKENPFGVLKGMSEKGDKR
jgi:uncharacterized metal-binding protein YceD (DUF177 family)